MGYTGIFSCSTSWNADRHVNGREMINEIKSLGFEKVELNYEVREEMLQDILDMQQKGEIEITSIHNVFPRIYDSSFGTDSLLLGYEDREMREKSIQLTINTVEHAVRFNAKAVVIHPGEVPVPKDYNRMLEELIVQGKKDTKEYRVLFNEMLEYREANAPRYVKLIGDSLYEICGYIERKGYEVALGIENRTMCHQIPVFHEVHTLLERLEGLPVYFWYDIGHGILQEQIGMFDNIQGAKSLKEKIIGVHIHDVDVVKDHLCPFILNDSFSCYMEIVKDVPIKVLELSSKKCRKEDVIISLKRLTEALSEVQ